MQVAAMKSEARANRRTGLALASVAIAFFAAIIAKYWLAQ